MSTDTGALIAGRYQRTGLIATGGMGEVWRARDTRLDRDVAVKLLKREYADDATFLERFRAEARHAGSVCHPGIAAVYDFGEADGAPYLVMELVAGEPLSALLARERRLPPAQALDIAIQVAHALEAAHQAGVIHRDVKPGNVVVMPSGTVKVTDFGIARAAAAAPVTQTGVVLGTAHYLSPEQAAGRSVTAASDVYSLGVVLFECLAGRRPFDGDNAVGIAMAHLYEDPPALPEDVPESVVTLVAQAMAKDPAERFRSAAAFARAAAATLGGLDPDVASRQPPPVPPSPPTAVLPVASLPAQAGRRRGKGPLVAGLVLAALLVFVAVAWAVGSRSPAPASPSPSARPVTTPSRPQLISLPRSLIGQPYDNVAAALRAQGLVPRTSFVRTDARPGTVVGITPLTGLRRGDTVTVQVAAGRADENDDRGDGKGKGEGKKDDD